MATAQGPCRPAPARALWFRCPKCGRGGDTFAVVYEPEAGLVEERLRVTCDRCRYVGYEDCADGLTLRAACDRLGVYVDGGTEPRSLPRALYVLLGMLLALGAAFAGRIAAVAL